MKHENHSPPSIKTEQLIGSSENIKVVDCSTGNTIHEKISRRKFAALLGVYDVIPSRDKYATEFEYTNKKTGRKYKIIRHEKDRLCTQGRRF